MDGLNLLQEAKFAGLTVTAEGDLLRIRGPRHAEPVAKRLLAYKPVVMAALAERYRFPAMPVGWTLPSWQGRLRQLADCCETLVPDRADWLRQWANALGGVA